MIERVNAIMQSYESEENVIQNLKDAGCSEKTIQAFMNKINTGKIKDGIRILEKHRCLLRNKLHQQQQHIDCLDYLLYHLKKEPAMYIRRK